ncbi:Uncharacterized protein GBIM_05620, partial [Gryllus bimaculatus]
MDLQSALICGGVAAVSAVVIYVISVFSMREKTYEEAIAEQRKLPEENLLLGRSAKDKAKDKKQKKLGKKVKEKTTDQDRNEQADMSSKSAVQTSKEDKKKKKKEKVKPILLNKDEHSIIREENVVKNNPESIAREVPKLQSSAKLSTKADGPPSNKQEKEKSSTKTENTSAPKTERAQISNKSDHETVEKDKDTGAKPEKAFSKATNIKAEKQAVPKADKAEKAATKVEKASGKPEKISAEKPEKNASAKPEKSAAAKGEKSATSVTAAKQEKPASTKSDKSAASKSEKNSNVQDTPTAKVPPPAPASDAVSAEVAPPVVTAVVVKESAAIPVKEKNRKKKSELATLQQMSGDRDGINMSLLLPIVQKAELSRSEIQILIDHLLNKQQNAGATDAEWIEGRQDPVVKLKKQLAEKEKQLAEELSASQGVQAKLKELRQELNTERSRLSHSCRQLEEALLAKTNEAQALATRLQHNQEAVNNEKQALTHQVQQLQQKLNEEHVRLCQVQEQEASLQQELLAQRQQMMAHLGEQEGALKTQVAQLMSQLKEQESVNSTLNLELQNQRDQQLGENNLLHERVAHAEKQMLLYQENAERAQDLARQVEEFARIRGDLEHRLSASQQHESALQFEANNLRKEMEELKAQVVGYESLKNESNRLRSDNDKLSNQLGQTKDVQLENQRLRDENERLTSQVNILPELQREASQLREENENLAAQVTAMTERPAAEGRENGDLQFHEEKQELHKGDFSLYEKTIQQKEGQLLQLSGELEEKTSLVKKLQCEINTYKTDINKLNEQLEEQRKKNNDLRIKNWKAMDALSTLEKSLQSKVQNSSPELVSEISQKVNQEQQNVIKQLLQRIFPDVRVEDCKSHEQWLEQFEKSASNFLSELHNRSQQTAPSVSEESAQVEELEKQNNYLQGLVTNYQTIIQDTSGMLTKLQNQVEEGEIRWRQQLQVKEAELEAVRQELEGKASTQVPSHSTETQSRVEDLQAKLKIKEQQQQDLESKYSTLTSSVEQLKEEKDGLTAQLQKEQEKSQDLSKELVRLRSLVQIGKDSLSQEHEMVVNLQQQVDKLNGVHQNHSVASNGPSSESSTVSQTVELDPVDILQFYFKIKFRFKNTPDLNSVHPSNNCMNSELLWGLYFDSTYITNIQPTLAIFDHILHLILFQDVLYNHLLVLWFILTNCKNCSLLFFFLVFNAVFFFFVCVVKIELTKIMKKIKLNGHKFSCNLKLTFYVKVSQSFFAFDIKMQYVCLFKWLGT